MRDVTIDPALGDGTQDATAAIQAALDTADLVRLPVGTYRTTAPLWIKRSNTTLRGEGRELSVLRAGHGGAMLLVGPNVGGVVYEPPLVPGPGKAARLDASGWYLDLRQSRHVDLDGWTALTIRLFYKPDPGASGSERALVTSCGRLLASDPYGYAAQIVVLPGGQLAGNVHTTVSGLAGVVGGNVSDGHTHEIELAWDGTTVRLFLDGALLGSAPATGTLVQAPESNFTLGPRYLTYPETEGDLAGPLGLVYSLEIADVARHTAAYAPSTTAYAPDAHTRLLLNFDTPAPCGSLVQGYWGQGPYVRGYLPWKRPSYDYLVTDARVQGVGLNGVGWSGGIDAWLAPRGSYDDVEVQACWWGVRLWNNSYLCRVAQLSVRNGYARSLYGLAFLQASGLGVARDVELVAGVVPLLARISSVHLDNAFVYGQCSVGALTDNAGLWRGFDFTTEALTAAPRACLALDGAVGVTLHGGALDASGFACPLVLVRGGDAHAFEGTAFKVGSETPCVVRVLAPPVRQVTVDGPALPNGPTSVPWFDVESAGVVVTPALVLHQ